MVASFSIGSDQSGEANQTTRVSSQEISQAQLVITQNLNRQPRASSSTLLSLPTEILCSILDSIPLTRTLAACCLICKTLLPLVLSRLYRNLLLRSSTRGLALPVDAKTILDDRSNRTLEALISSRHKLHRYPTKIDFDLRSNFTAAQIGATLAMTLERCQNVVEIKLGKGDRGHGLSFAGLWEMLARLDSDERGSDLRLKILRIEECVGNGTTLANVLSKLPHLVDLRVGQFLLEPSDFEEGSPPPPVPTFRLHTFVAKYRLTPFAFDICTSSSWDTLRSIDVPINERNGLDLSRCSALTDVTLSLSLTFTLTSSSTQTSYFSNKRSNSLPSSSPPASALPFLAKLSTNFRTTLESIPYLTRLTIKGSWDEGDQPLDIVRHASLLSHLSGTTIEILSIKTELNSIALVEWLDGIDADAEGSRGRGRLRKLKIWQKRTFSFPKCEFQRTVREKVQRKAVERRIICEWYKYEKW
ncbi:hypothetical protein JCM3765_005639 [Sporobolomyces pararoseus]